MADQLKMRRRSSADVPEVALPPGYRLRHYVRGDEGVWADIINRAGALGEYTEEKVVDTLTGQPRFHPEGLLFVTTDAGEPVATACAWLGTHDDWRTGSVHMVAVVPEHQGKRLSYWVCAAVLHVFRDWGVPEVCLTTDEFRTAAVKVYIQLDFEPVMRTPEHYQRWCAVYRSYGMEERATALEKEAALGACR
ncbi:MAG TPA: GNAT family N-acetyltransferase [Candidatus Latescibacteria bacterium]|nr:GNAT family N-acetyltransferase [Candidatus Latescibacterota bacterium]